MTLKDLAHMFNSSLAKAFSIKKFLCLFGTLILSGLVYLFFQGLAAYAPAWLAFPLKYVPLFLVIGILLAAGTILIRLYTAEKEGESLPLMQTILGSWEPLLKATYLAFPLLLAFIVFWVLIGLFLLLKSIPYLGPLLAVVLAFAPFLLNLGTLLLFFVALLGFFFVTPSLATSGRVNRKALLSRIKSDIFSNLLLLGVAYLPVYIVWRFVGNAASMTVQLFALEGGPLEMLLQSVFMMLPYVAVLTPAVTFFFNFASEAAQQVRED